LLGQGKLPDVVNFPKTFLDPRLRGRHGAKERRLEQHVILDQDGMCPTAAIQRWRSARYAHHQKYAILGTQTALSMSSHQFESGFMRMAKG
jgi:hypothetical protein